MLIVLEEKLKTKWQECDLSRPVYEITQAPRKQPNESANG